MPTYICYPFIPRRRNAAERELNDSGPSRHSLDRARMPRILVVAAAAMIASSGCTEVVESRESNSPQAAARTSAPATKEQSDEDESLTRLFASRLAGIDPRTCYATASFMDGDPKRCVQLQQVKGVIVYKHLPETLVSGECGPVHPERGRGLLDIRCLGRQCSCRYSRVKALDDGLPTQSEVLFWDTGAYSEESEGERPVAACSQVAMVSVQYGFIDDKYGGFEVGHFWTGSLTPTPDQQDVPVPTMCGE